jgi:hypothetical protein
MSDCNFFLLSNYRNIEYHIGEFGLLDIGSRPQSIGQSDIGFRKNDRLPTYAFETFRWGTHRLGTVHREKVFVFNSNMVLGGKCMHWKRFRLCTYLMVDVIVYILFQLPVDDSYIWVSLDDPSGVGRGGGGQGE